MTNRTKNTIAVLAIAALIGAVSLYIYKDLHKKIAPEADVPTGIKLETEGGKGGYTVSVLPNASTTPKEVPLAPSLNFPAKNSSGMNPQTFKIVAEDMAALTEELKKDSSSEEKWLKLALYEKMLGNYNRAVEILNYLSILWPNDYIIYNNLGDIYQFYLKNYPLAEKNWLKVLEFRTDYVSVYENLYGLYSGLYTAKKSEALPILLKGQKNNPDTIVLILDIARHYRSVGDVAQAKIYYDKSIEQAKSSLNVKLESEIRTEMESLK